MNNNDDHESIVTQPQDLGHCMVTGAAGFVGNNLVSALLKKGHKVTALVRNTELEQEHPELSCVNGDIQNKELLIDQFQGIDTVFHTAAFIATMGGSAATQAYRDKAYAINVVGSKNVIEACQVNGVKRLVHTSSVDVCFNGTEDLDMDEHTAYADTFHCLYTETKMAAEQAVLAADGQKGLLSCAIRPDGIWGPGGLMLDTLVEQLLMGRMAARIGGDGALHDHVHVDNLVHAHLLAAEALVERSPVCGRAYFISDGQPDRIFKFVKPLFEGLGYKVPKASIPIGPLYFMSYTWQWLHFKIGIGEPLFSPHELNKLSVSHVVTSAAATRDFDYQPIKSVADGMTECIDYYHKQVASDSL